MVDPLLQESVNRRPEDLVDLARYPIDDLDTARGRRLIAEVRASAWPKQCCALCPVF